MSYNRNISTAAPASPFFLSVDSPIDQGPSIDAVAAAPLEGSASQPCRPPDCNRTPADWPMH